MSDLEASAIESTATSVYVIDANAEKMSDMGASHIDRACELLGEVTV